MNKILERAGFQVQVSGGDADRCVFAVLYLGVPAFGGLAPAPDTSPSLPDSGGYKVELRMRRRIGVIDEMEVGVYATFIGNTLSESPIPLLAAAPPAVWQELKKLYADFPSTFGHEQTLFVERDGTPISFLNDRDLLEEWIRGIPIGEKPDFAG